MIKMEKEKYLNVWESVLCEKEKRMECRERARKGDRKGEKGRGIDWEGESGL